MAKTKEELMAHAKAVRAALKQDMSPQQRLDHEAALKRKAEKKVEPPKAKDPKGLVVDEFEASIERSLSRFLAALEGVERHHERSWLTSAVVQDFAAALDEIRGMVRKGGA